MQFIDKFFEFLRVWMESRPPDRSSEKYLPINFMRIKIWITNCNNLLRDFNGSVAVVCIWFYGILHCLRIYRVRIIANHWINTHKMFDRIPLFLCSAHYNVSRDFGFWFFFQCSKQPPNSWCVCVRMLLSGFSDWPCAFFAFDSSKCTVSNEIKSHLWKTFYYTSKVSARQ